MSLGIVAGTVAGTVAADMVDMCDIVAHMMAQSAMEAVLWQRSNRWRLVNQCRQTRYVIF